LPWAATRANFAPMSEPATEPERPDPMSAWGFWLIAAFSWAITLYAASLSYERVALVDAASRFEETLGKVEVSGLKARGGSGQVNASVVVSYEVEGTRYELSTNGLDGKVARGAGSGSASADAEALVAAHPIGQPVAVYYDPQAPSVSALTNRIAGGYALGTTITCLLLSLGYSGWLWRRRRS
jgi:hypothetical protein